MLWRDSSGALTNWLGTANGGFTNNWGNSGTNVPTDWSVVGTGDFNGDGNSDILWRSSEGVVTNWLGNDAGGFSTNWTYANLGVPLEWQIVGVGDFNGDSMSDVMWQHDSGVLVNWLGNSNGGFAANWDNAPTGVGAPWVVAATGDYNGDGRDDLFWRREDNGYAVEWLATASGGFVDNSAAFSGTIPTSWHVQADPFG